MYIWMNDSGNKLQDSKLHRIGEVASASKLSIRTLRHYDEVGLLEPSGRSEAGYRLYAQGDLEKLQIILFYRTLEFSLDSSRDLMNAMILTAAEPCCSSAGRSAINTASYSRC